MRLLKLKEYTVLWILTLVTPVFSGQCRIDILNKKNSREKIRLQFNSKLRSKKQCQALAQMHRPNFNPAQVKYKIVNYHWSGSKIVRTAHLKQKKSIHLSRHKKLNRRPSPKF